MAKRYSTQEFWRWLSGVKASEFDSQYPRGGSQPSATPVPGDWDPFLVSADPRHTCGTQIYMLRKHPSIKREISSASAAFPFCCGAHGGLRVQCAFTAKGYTEDEVGEP